MSKRSGSKTGERVAGLRQVFGSYSPITTYTHISPQRLRALAEGASATRAEAARIAAYNRRLSEGHVTYPLQEAAHRRGVSLGQIGRELQGVARGEFMPRQRLSLSQVSRLLGVEHQAVWHLSQEPGLMGRRNRRTGEVQYREVRPSRGISDAYLTRDGKIVGIGSDGNAYVAYTVTNRQTGERRFFWGRFQSVGYLTTAEFDQQYGVDDYEFDIETAIQAAEAEQAEAEMGSPDAEE